MPTQELAFGRLADAILSYRAAVIGGDADTESGALLALADLIGRELAARVNPTPNLN
jgi:hypothetical protein